MLGNKKVMGDNIQYYMDLNHIERRDFAKAIEVSYSSLTDWINGNTYPRIDKIQRMADYFKIEKSDLVEPRNTNKKTTSFRIPVLGRVAAGIPLEMVEDVTDWEEIGEPMAKKGNIFALKISGNSMEPRIQDGDVVIIHQQDDAESGDTVIVTVNGDDATCKRLRKYKDGIELIPMNPTYSPMFFSNQEISEKPVKILGKVIELRAKF
jgi:repressor LexA